MANELQLDENIVTYLFESAVYMHDFGKATPYFQYYKMAQVAKKPHGSGHLTYHSRLSAIYYFDQMSLYINEHVPNGEMFNYALLLLILTECIAKHHTSLANLETFSQSFDQYLLDLVTLKQETELFDYFAYMPNFLNEPVAKNNYISRITEEVLTNTSSEFREIAYSAGLVFYSLLCVSDILATKKFAQDFKFEEDTYDDGLKRYLNLSYNQSPLSQAVMDYQKTLPKVDKTINDIRSKFILNMDTHLKQIKPINNLFHLEELVGIGKTHAAKRFITYILNQYDIKKVYWSVPYLAIANQLDFANKELDSQAVRLDSVTPIRTEYHEFQVDFSKMVVNDQLMNYRNATFTFVRFFNLLFNHSKGNALKRLSLRNSVIIIDELQSVDILLMNQFLNQITIMSQLLHFKLLFMSATLPKLETTISLSEPDIFRKEPLLTKRNKLNMEFYDKGYTAVDLFNQLEISNKRVLIQTVTKKHAQEIYDALKPNNQQVHLYTGDTSQHDRQKIIDQLKEKNPDGSYTCKQLVLVTTNAIEAGVDISMNLAIVNLTSLDSLEQLSGRVNRSNEFKPEDSLIYVINYEPSDFLSPIKTTYTRSLGVNAIQQQFEEKNYSIFMSQVLNLAKKSQQDLNQRQATQQLAFKDVSQMMRLITTDSCFYYHICNDEAKQLMTKYQEYTQKLGEDLSFYDEYYIKRKNVLINLHPYRREITDYKIKQIFIEQYGEEPIAFHTQPEPFGQSL